MIPIAGLNERAHDGTDGPDFVTNHFAGVAGLYTDNRIGVRFQYEWHDAAGLWYRSYGDELWEFDKRGLMQRREASINDVHILEPERRFSWPAPGPQQADHPGIPDVQ